MALLKEFVTPSGVHVRVFDDCYRDAAPEELARRRQRLREEVWKIDRAHQVRQMEARQRTEAPAQE